MLAIPVKMLKTLKDIYFWSINIIQLGDLRSSSERRAWRAEVLSSVSTGVTFCCWIFCFNVIKLLMPILPLLSILCLRGKLQKVEKILFLKSGDISCILFNPMISISNYANSWNIYQHGDWSVKKMPRWIFSKDLVTVLGKKVL